MSVENEIKKGNFVIGQCIKCKKIVWPPSEYCDMCFSLISPKKGTFEGKIIEFSKQDENYFCLAEFEKHVRIIGKMSSVPEINQHVKIEKCGIKNGNYFFEFSVL
jgi:hypothetical protein